MMTNNIDNSHHHAPLIDTTNTNDAEDEKRKSPRFNLRAYADMQHSTKKWEAHLLDISASGVRMAILDEHLLRKDDTLRVHIALDDHLINITTKKELHLHGRIAHIREHIVGVDCQPDTPADKELLEQLLTTIIPS